ncbi:MAG TPA: hypothetical protein VFH78_06400 [Candidatus Thermoplasmatota archaeon]|nr:hypothetical protein [Candidatus Thermoplasmatota archaeon]
MKLLWTSLLAVSLLIAASPFAPARPGGIHVYYQGSTPLGAGALEQECQGAVALGVVCLAVPAGAKRMGFLVDDASDLAVGGTYYVYDASGEITALGGHCGAGVADVPAGGTFVVRLESVNGPLNCAAEGKLAGQATRGWVAFTLR